MLIILDRITENLTVFMYVSFVAIAFLQVVFRYVFNNSLTWSEELCRYLFVWTVFLGAAVAILERKHMRVDLIEHKIPKSIKKYYIVLIDMLSIVYFLLLAYYGYGLANRNMMQVSPAMAIPLGIIYIAIPFASVLAVINIIRVMIRDFRAGDYTIISGTGGDLL